MHSAYRFQHTKMHDKLYRNICRNNYNIELKKTALTFLGKYDPDYLEEFIGIFIQKGNIDDAVEIISQFTIDGSVDRYKTVILDLLSVFDSFNHVTFTRLASMVSKFDPADIEFLVKYLDSNDSEIVSSTIYYISLSENKKYKDKIIMLLDSTNPDIVRTALQALAAEDINTLFNKYCELADKFADDPYIRNNLEHILRNHGYLPHGCISKKLIKADWNLLYSEDADLVWQILVSMRQRPLKDNVADYYDRLLEIMNQTPETSEIICDVLHNAKLLTVEMLRPMINLSCAVARKTAVYHTHRLDYKLGHKMALTCLTDPDYSVVSMAVNVLKNADIPEIFPELQTVWDKYNSNLEILNKLNYLLFVNKYPSDCFEKGKLYKG